MQFYLDLSEKITMALVNPNGYVVFYKESDYSCTFLNE